MRTDPVKPARVAIACGGTGGHLFPGVAVAEQLRALGCQVTLLVSAKEVDQQALRCATGQDSVALPAVGLQPGAGVAFARGLLRSYAAARRLFKPNPPQAALAMGGFTSVAPMLAARACGASAFLHESNSVPGRANRWLSWIVEQAFITFPSAASGLHTRRVIVTGTPVRRKFQPMDAGQARAALRLDSGRSVLLVMGGSQGAGGVNQLLIRSLPALAQRAPDLQYIHLTGRSDFEEVKAVYAALNLNAVVQPFLAEMELVLGAASAAISRAGASSLAELAAMQVPAVLIPYPAAIGNHQLLNARAFESTGAARLLEQSLVTPDSLKGAVLELVMDGGRREGMRRALAQWQTPRAAEHIANRIMDALAKRKWPFAAQTTTFNFEAPAEPPATNDGQRSPEKLMHSSA
jgi:UDP-N-acetylglucosamine--N-acetylmuramyl-(pentapeptide) pyrophosphoryl-undecaprenol N-acetylglucosamine transferase